MFRQYHQSSPAIHLISYLRVETPSAHLLMVFQLVKYICGFGGRYHWICLENRALLCVATHPLAVRHLVRPRSGLLSVPGPL